MSDRYFVDTNILMYAHDSSAGAKHERAKAVVEELWRDRAGVVSTQVLQELSVNLRRKAGRPLDAKATREVIADYLTWQVIVNGAESILEAIDLEARYQISFWDALVLQAAQASGVEILYSEDLSDGQRYGSVRVVNPLRAGVSHGTTASSSSRSVGPTPSRAFRGAARLCPRVTRRRGV